MTTATTKPKVRTTVYRFDSALQPPPSPPHINSLAGKLISGLNYLPQSIVLYYMAFNQKLSGMKKVKKPNEPCQEVNQSTE